MWQQPLPPSTSWPGAPPPSPSPCAAPLRVCVRRRSSRRVSAEASRSRGTAGPDRRRSGTVGYPQSAARWPALDCSVILAAGIRPPHHSEKSAQGAWVTGCEPTKTYGWISIMVPLLLESFLGAGDNSSRTGRRVGAHSAASPGKPQSPREGRQLIHG